MALAVLYEKPGRPGDARQKGRLTAAGHVVEVCDLPASPWMTPTPHRFSGTWPVAAWSKPMAPAVRDGELDPTALDEASALAAMIAQPILIRLP